MNYLKHYYNLIRKAENRTPPEGYTEKHHTFPKSIYGKNNRLVVLTAREHYIAHALLEKAFIKRYGLHHYKTQKMITAFWRMNNQNTKNEYFNSYMYHSSRERFVETIKGENNHNYGRIYTPEERKILSDKTKGIPKTERQRKNISKGKKGKPQTKEHSENMGKARIGGRWWNDGLGNRKYSKECPDDGWVLGMDCPCTEERKEKIRKNRKSRTGYKHSEETKNKLMEKKCKYSYEITSPSGEVFITNNLSDFCRKNPQYGLYRRLMCDVANGKQKHHKGWMVRILGHLP